MGMIWDSLVNFVNGLGTTKDPTTASQFYLNLTNKNDQENYYRQNWVARRVVDAPAEDASREWRAWHASNAQIEKIEALEKRLQIQKKFKDAIIRGRLYGGAALVIGVDQGQSSDPLDYDKVVADDLKWVVVLNRYELNAGPRIYDVASPWYTRPSYYIVSAPIAGVNDFGQQRRSLWQPPGLPDRSLMTAPSPELAYIHPSRVIEFCGNELPDWRLAPLGGTWGDSVLETAKDEIRQLATIVAGVAAMVNDAKVDVIKIPDFSKQIATKEYESLLLKRFGLTNQAKSMLNALILDKEEDWDRIETTFSGLPDLINTVMKFTAGAGGVPLSRLMGAAPSTALSQKGGSGGEVDVRNYYDAIASVQETEYRPRLEPLDECIIRSALGKRDPKIHYEWNALYRSDPAEDADISAKKAATFQTDINCGLINENVLRRARLNQLIEDGTYPGIEDAIDEFGEAPDIPVARQWSPSIDPNTGEPPAPAGPPAPDGGSKGGGGSSSGDPFGKGGGQVHDRGFDPEEARDKIGRWTAGSGGAGGEGEDVIFASPNIAHIDLARSVKALRSTRQRNMIKAAADIDHEIGISGKTTSTIGAWADGAENAVMTEFPHASFDQLKVDGAMRGHLADQKQVLVFRHDPEGKDMLFRFDAKGEIGAIHKHLLEDGVAFHTIAPHKGGGEVYVFGSDEDTAKAVAKGASRYGSAVEAESGVGEFIGTEKQDGTDREQRDDARADYERIIGSTGNKSYAQEWGRIRDSHGGTLLKPLAGSQGHPDLVSSRNASAVGVGAKQQAQFAEAAKNYRRIDVAAMKEDPAGFAHNVGLFKNAGLYPMLRPDEMKGSPEDQAKAVQDRMESNIRFVYGLVSPENRAKWSHWYDGGHALVEADAKKYDLPEASVAGAYAALSPDQLWDINVWMGQKVIDAYKTQQQTPWSDEMTKVARDIFRTPVNKKLLAKIKGKSLGELSDPVEKGAWIRTFVDATDKDRSYRRVNPDGTFGEAFKTKAGKPSKAGWAQFGAIGNAVKALDSNGDRELISDAMGAAHKVRSFYNNLLDPDSANGDVTIDTHAIGAALLSPFGQKAEQVSQAFGTGIKIEDQSPFWEPAKNSTVTGVSGTYGLYADAYRHVAEQEHIEPRKLQSIVWEAKREMFADNSKRKAEAIDAAWREFHDGKADLESTQRKIAGIAVHEPRPYPPRKPEGKK
jgi:uncharacterized protein